jgi:hypothetical protein
MLNKHVHLRDQVRNRIPMIMQESTQPLMLRHAIAILLMAIFVASIGF